MSDPRVRVFRGSAPLPAVPADDRGLAYGDGLFETLRVHRGAVPWWSRHWARLSAGAARLGIPLPDQAQVRDEALGLFADGGDGVLKLLLTRGGGGRGYAPAPEAVPTWLLARHALPAAWPAEGVHVDWCDTVLTASPSLVGLKHCNRLEQVLARAEWADPARHEGLMCNAAGGVVCATAANLAWCEGERWYTPAVAAGAVAGICRGWLLEHGVGEAPPPSRARLLAADSVLLCNAVRGILPVARIAARAWQAPTAAMVWRARLAAAEPMFAVPPGWADAS
jgi:4-amino-4-deoxychorismate lyase